jgi:large subunit ribosomal protein L15
MLSNLKPTKGSRKLKHRVGRGQGSGWGDTAGRGNHGQLSRSGGGPRPGFEGGQIPLFQRLPKRGFNNVNRKEYAVVNLSDLEANFVAGDVVTPESLLQKRILSKLLSGVKVLGNGELTKAITVKANKISESAKTKLEASGSTFEVI